MLLKKYALSADLLIFLLCASPLSEIQSLKNEHGQYEDSGDADNQRIRLKLQCSKKPKNDQIQHYGCQQHPSFRADRLAFASVDAKMDQKIHDKIEKGTQGGDPTKVEEGR